MYLKLISAVLLTVKIGRGLLTQAVRMLYTCTLDCVYITIVLYIVYTQLTVYISLVTIALYIVYKISYMPLQLYNVSI